MIVLALLLICWYPAASHCGTCKFYNHTFHCAHINQDDFLYQLFKEKNFLATSSVDTVIIEDSIYPTVERFPDLDSLLPNMTIKNLVIRRSAVKDICEDTFSALKNLNSLDLSWNQIEDLKFFSGVLRTVDNVDLSHNNIVELNLNHLKGVYSSLSIRLNNNKISVIIPAGSKMKVVLNFLDLSHNQLTTYIENYNFYSHSLNISYNNLTKFNVLEKNILTVYGNHVNSFTTKDVVGVIIIYTSSIPNNTLYVKDLYSMADRSVKILKQQNPLKLKNWNHSPLIVDISNSSLIDISSNYFKDVGEWDVLNLSYNNLTNLDKLMFSNARIRNINLSFSGIKTITQNCFRDASPYLQSINLIGNFLNDTDICASLPNLRTLDLSRNIFTEIRKSTLEGCISLQHLTITKCYIDHIEPGVFADIPIEVLDLSENMISSISDNIFSNLSHVTRINLRKNNISFIGSYTFKGLEYLVEIDLTENLLRYVDEYAFTYLTSLVLIDLSNSRLKISNTNSLTTTKEEDRVIFRAKAFDNLNKLRVVNVSNLGSMLFENEVVFKSSLVETVDLANNGRIILNSYAFRNSSVENIIFTGNTIEKINTGTFRNLNNLRELNLSNLGINELRPYAFHNIPNLKFIDLRNNSISGINKNVFTTVKVKDIFLNEITEPIYLDNTINVNKLTVQFSGILREKTISNIYLKKLYIVDSHIDVIKNNSFLGSYNLEKIDFINSSVSIIEPKCLAGLFSLLSLDASPLFQNTTVLKDINVFEDLISLETLKLSDIGLVEIKENAFYGLVKLKELYLDGNNLSSINHTTFKHLNITLVDLSRNAFTLFNLASLTESLPFLKSLIMCCGGLKDVSVYNGSHTSLQFLDLSSNELTYLEERILKSLTGLNILYLNNNKLHSVGGLNYTTDLMELRLDSNNLTAVYEQFKKTQWLRFLNISNNPRYFEDYPGYARNPLADLQRLYSLYLDNTHSFGFPYSTYFIFPALRRVGINNNNYSCKHVEELIFHFNRRSVDYNPYNPKYDVSNVEGIACRR